MDDGKSNAKDTPLYSEFAFDDAFRTMETYCNDLLIPFVNYLFDEHFDESSVVTHLRNEHYTEHQDHSQVKRISDSHFEISQGTKVQRYHLECESSSYDDSILIRLFEYGAQLALDTVDTDAEGLHVRFPHTGLLLLRGKEDAPDQEMINIETPGGRVSYRVPIIKMSSISLDEIFELRLYMLIPFYIFNYEKELDIINTDEKRILELVQLYSDMLDKLQNMTSVGSLSVMSESVIILLTHKVLYKLTAKHRIVQEKVGDIMGGKVLDDLPPIRAYVQGKEEGKAEGEAERNQLREQNEQLKKEIERLKAAVLA